MQVEGRVAQTATSPTGSRVLQACVKHCTPEQRQALLKEVMPNFLDLSKKPYSHFLVCRLIALAPKQDLKGIPHTPPFSLPTPSLTTNQLFKGQLNVCSGSF